MMRLLRRLQPLLGTRAQPDDPAPEASEASPPTPARWDLGDRVLDCVTAYNRFGGYVVPRSASHRIAAQRVLSGKVYEPRTIELLRSECGDGDIVHAGTFFGDFLPGLSSGLAPGARVYAFEPNPENYRCAAMTVDLNGLDNVVVECAGLGAESGVSALQTTSRDGTPRGGSSRIVDPSTTPAAVATIEVPVHTIDARIPADRQVSIVQLDVEGYEQAALAGALGTIERCRPIIVVETMPDDAWLAEHLTPLGYRVTERVHHNTVLRT